MAGEGALGGGRVVRRGETGYDDGGPAAAAAAAVATAAASGRGSLPVISVLSVLANLTNYTPPQPGLSPSPAHWSRKGAGCVLYQR